jgi:hypothetical protein
MVSVLDGMRCVYGAADLEQVKGQDYRRIPGKITEPDS